jgi:hypothetical protein
MAVTNRTILILAVAAIIVFYLMNKKTSSSSSGAVNSNKGSETNGNGSAAATNGSSGGSGSGSYSNIGNGNGKVNIETLLKGNFSDNTKPIDLKDDKLAPALGRRKAKDNLGDLSHLNRQAPAPQPIVLPGKLSGCLGTRLTQNNTDNLQTNEDINREAIQNPLTIEKNGVVYCSYSAVSSCGGISIGKYRAIQNYDESYDILKDGVFQKNIMFPAKPVPKAVSLSKTGDLNFYYK